jgi:threonyl-tRNA synthetase
MLGSVERMAAVLTEHFGGKWPFWLSPRQCIIVPIDPKYIAFAEEVRAFFIR